jgi:DNA-binding CsgD family transcriptional regulator
MISNEVFSELVADIYRSTADFSQWPNMMRKISGAFGGDCAVLGVTDETENFSAYVAPLTDPAFLTTYHAHYHAISPLMPRIRALAAGSVVTDRMVLPREQFEKSDIYNEWILPQGIKHKIYAALLSEPGRRVILGVHSGQEFNDDQIRLCRLLTPHLQQALEITLRTIKLSATAESSVDVLDRLGDGVIIVDVHGAPKLVNKAAQALFGPGGGLRLEAGRLSALKSSEAAELQRLLNGCFARHGLATGGRMRLSSAIRAAPLTLIVAPTAAGGPWPMPRQAAALLLIKLQQRPGHFAERELADRFGFTRAEMELARRLCEGLSVREAATRNGIRDSTARSYLKQIFDKTGVRRQAELVRNLLLLSQSESNDGADSLACRSKTGCEFNQAASHPADLIK